MYTFPPIVAGTLFVTLLVSGFFAAVAVSLIALGHHYLRRKRLIENVPTTQTTNVMPGGNELKGRAVPITSVQSYLTEQDVVYYSYSIHEEQKERVRKRGGKKKTKKKWKRIDNEKEAPTFELHDESGSIEIKPASAEITAETVVDKICKKDDLLYYGKGPSGSVSRSTGRRKFREEIIGINEDIYVLGSARMGDDAPRPWIESDMLDDTPFIISVKGEKSLIRKYGLFSLGLFTAALFAALFSTYSYGSLVEHQSFIADNLGISTAVTAGIVALSISVLYAKIIYDNLTDLRDREEEAWSMIDDEFQRRTRLADDLMELVATYPVDDSPLNTASRSAAVGLSFDDTEQARRAIEEQSDLLETLFNIVDGDSVITSDQQFLDLSEQLADCEEALAQSLQFYNTSVDRLNGRIYSFPDILVSPFSGADKQDPLPIDDLNIRTADFDGDPSDEANCPSEQPASKAATAAD